MKWFDNLPSSIRHLLTNLATALVLAQAIKHGYLTPEQATQTQSQISASIPLK